MTPESPNPSLEPAETARTMRGNTDVTIAVNEDERDPLVPADLLRCLTNEVQRRAKRVRCNAGLGGAGAPDEALDADPDAVKTDARDTDGGGGSQEGLCEFRDTSGEPARQDRQD